MPHSGTSWFYLCFDLFSIVIFCFYVSYSQDMSQLSSERFAAVAALHSGSISFPCLVQFFFHLFFPDLFDTFIDLTRRFVPMDQKSVISQPTSDSTISANIHSDSTTLHSHQEKEECGCSPGGSASASPYPSKVPTNSMAILIRRTDSSG